jgi:hypothetical protein
MRSGRASPASSGAELASRRRAPYFARMLSRLPLHLAGRLWALLLVVTVALSALAPGAAPVAVRSGSAFSVDTVEMVVAPPRPQVAVARLEALPRCPFCRWRPSPCRCWLFLHSSAAFRSRRRPPARLSPRSRCAHRAPRAHHPTPDKTRDRPAPPGGAAHAVLPGYPTMTIQTQTSQALARRAHVEALLTAYPDVTPRNTGCSFTTSSARPMRSMSA